MNCKQIRDLLDDYNANELPGFKVTWVAQHLGGCQACRVHVALPQVECKPVPSVEWPDEEPRAEPTAALPRWIPAAVFALMLCVALLILLLQHLNQAEAGIARSQSLRYKSSVQTQRGVTGTLAQLVRHGDVATGVIQFLGQGLASPKDLETWVTVIDSEGGAHETTVQEVIPGLGSLLVRFQVKLPPEVDNFRIFIGAVYVEMSEPWSVQLPRPVNGLGKGGVRLLGNPAGVRLVAYGLVGDMLVVHLRAPLADGRLTGSRFDLADAAGTQIAPSLLQETSGPDDHAVWIQYPVPRETHLPLSVVGERLSRKELGPWQIQISLMP